MKNPYKTTSCGNKDRSKQKQFTIAVTKLLNTQSNNTNNSNNNE